MKYCMKEHKELPLSMGQIRADMIMARSAIEYAETLSSKESKYLKGQTAYHHQQATEKMIKIQIYAQAEKIDHYRMYKHSIEELLRYANEMNIEIIVPPYIKKNQEIISTWEATGRYDISMVVRIDTLKKCEQVVSEWHDSLQRIY